MRRRVTRLVAATIVAVGVGAAIAGADADPASDVLLLQNVFYPYTPAVSASLQSALGAETSAAARAHFPLKVALIDARQDLGAVPIFFDKPQQYAHFLYQEISFQGKQPLLVVMPDGYGEGLDAATAAAAASLTKPTGTSSDELARAAITAVRALAAAADHPIKATATPSSPTNSGSATTPILLAVALAVLAAAGTIITLRNRSPGTVRDSGAAHAVVGERVVEPRLVVGALLILGGVVWAIARGLQLYGINLAYDLDQPPVLLVLVGAFLLYRSRRPRVR